MSENKNTSKYALSSEQRYQVFLASVQADVLVTHLQQLTPDPETVLLLEEVFSHQNEKAEREKILIINAILAAAYLMIWMIVLVARNGAEVDSVLEMVQASAGVTSMLMGFISIYRTGIRYDAVKSEHVGRDFQLAIKIYKKYVDLVKNSEEHIAALNNPHITLQKLEELYSEFLENEMEDTQGDDYSEDSEAPVIFEEPAQRRVQ